MQSTISVTEALSERRKEMRHESETRATSRIGCIYHSTFLEDDAFSNNFCHELSQREADDTDDDLLVKYTYIVIMFSLASFLLSSS